MKQEDKELLLKDLCARLPYGVKVAIEYSEGKYTRIYDLREIDNDVTSELRQQVTVWNYGFYSSVISYPLIDCRPYLRSMLSMTDEERSYYNDRWFEGYHTKLGDDMVSEPEIPSYINWLLEHHFDFMGLITKGLAIEVTESNNPYGNS